MSLHFNTKHGHAKGRSGSSFTPTYRTWQGIIQRCTNPADSSYHRYGARGITVCERWREFTLFLADVGEKPPGTTIDRIDNSKGYEPGNTRWASVTEQNQNRRTTRLSPTVVQEIRERFACGESTFDIARSLGFDAGTVRSAALRRTWRNVP